MEEKKNKWGLLGLKDHNHFVPFVIIVTAVVALWLLFFSHSSVLNWVRAALEVRSQEKEMVRLQSEMDEMDREIDMLTTNRDSLETFARETYHFTAPGEDVYIAE